MGRRIWLETLLASLVVAGMVGCIVVAGVALGEEIVPGWSGGYLAIACMLAAIEAFLTYRLFRARHMYISGGMRYRLSELFILFVLFQIAVDLSSGLTPIERGAPRLSGSGAILFIVVFLSWFLAGNTAADLDTIQREAANVESSAEKAARGGTDEIRRPMELVRPALSGLLQRFFVGGVLLFILAGLSQSQNARALRVTRPDLGGPLANVLLYFALGIAMMGLLHYGTLSVQWAAGRRVVSAELPGHWLRYALAFLLGVALLAMLLPTSYGTDVLGAVRGGMESFLSSAGTWIAHLMQRLDLGPPPVQHTSVPKHPPARPPHGTGPGKLSRRQHPVNLNPLFVARAILFWLAVAALAVYMFRGVRREGAKGTSRSRLSRILAWLAGVWRGLRGRVRSAAAMARPRRRKLQAPVTVAPPANPLSRLRFASMSPRERIVYYFTSIAQRLEREGQRRPSHTALELEAQIAPILQDAAPDMRVLTQSYLEARYSDHPVEEPEESRAQRSWKRIRQALRTTTRGRTS